MIVLVVSSKAAKVINMIRSAIAKSPTGVSFFSIKKYANRHGEVSNQLINIGVNYQNQVEKDIDFLRNLDITKHQWKSSSVEIEKARVELIESFLRPSKSRSDGQKNAYTIITDGIKVHNETGKLYIYGYRVSKTVLEEGSYPIVNHSVSTLAKNELRKHLKTNNFVNFALDIGNELTVSGNTIEI